jgi:hypothetical protein
MSRNQRFRMVARESPMEDYRYAPNLVGGGQGLALLHQNLQVAALLIKYLLTEHYRSVQCVFNLTNALMVLRLDLIVAGAIVFLQNLIIRVGCVPEQELRATLLLAGWGIDFKMNMVIVGGRWLTPTSLDENWIVKEHFPYQIIIFNHY